MHHQSGLTDRGDLKAELKCRAHELGFPLFGIAPADCLSDDLDHLREWLESGHSADMHFMSTQPERRANPRLVLENACSVIMLGMPYGRETVDSSASIGYPEGRVSRFALIDDYHQIIQPRLTRLSAWLETSDAPECRTRCLVDSGPLLERAFARRAGLGYIGRNCCLINPVYGSWVFLSAIVTTSFLPPDNPLPEADYPCEDCRRCLDACPTGALCESFQVDARRCLSYHTIETHDDLDPFIMTRMGNRLFGCDACQEACPCNKDATGTSEPALRKGIDSSLLGLGSILQIRSNKQFNELFRGTSLLRARRKGLLRNAIVAAANLRRKDMADRIAALANDESQASSIRSTAQWALRLLEDQNDL